ncbi:MAG: class I SAM-dependent methyltransferase [Candidatus Kerfeldbacteria bacterium]
MATGSTIAGMKCPVCGSDVAKFLFSQRDRRKTMPGTFDVFRCRDCHTEFIVPPDNLSEFYQSDYYVDLQSNRTLQFRAKEWIIKERYRATRKIAWKKIAEFFGQFVSALPSKTGRILDFGCACGDILHLLKNAGFDVYGMDISSIAVDTCHSHGLDNVRLGTEKDLSVYSDDFFDSIRGSHVIEHMPDPKIFAALAYRKLKKGGELVLQTPNINSMGKWFGSHTKYYYDIPRHVVLFTNGSMRLLLRQQGFKTVKISYVNFFGDQMDNFGVLLQDKNPKLHKLLFQSVARYLIRLLFIPVEVVLSCTGYGQTMTVTAVKE